MARAIWNGAVLAESDDIEVVEGNLYFPESALDKRYFEPSTHTSVCVWKGKASYYDVVVDGERNSQAAWFYPSPLPLAKKVAGRVAFWRGVTVEP